MARPCRSSGSWSHQGRCSSVLYSELGKNRVLPLVSWQVVGKYASQGTQRIAQASLVSASWPSANRAIYLPFELWQPFTIYEACINNGSGASAGSWDVGVYTADGTRIVSSGAVAQSGVNAIQTISLSARLGRGVYYMALLATSGSTTIYRSSAGAANDYLLWGALQEATGGTLPATATFATNSTAFIPCWGLFASAH